MIAVIFKCVNAVLQSKKVKKKIFKIMKKKKTETLNLSINIFNSCCCARDKI